MASSISVTGHTSDVQDSSKRDRSAATDPMIVCELAPSMYEVFSGERNRYVVDLETGACTCDDWHYRQPDGECKHRRRVRQTLGIDPIPNVDRIDPTLPRQRNR